MKEKKFSKFNLIAIICIIIFSVTLSQKTLQNDTFYTIKIGEHIIDTKEVDMKEPFSWHENMSYTYPHWLYDTGIYLIYNVGSNIATSLNSEAENGGLTAIYISTMLIASILGILIYYSNIKISKNHILSLFLTLGVVYCLKDFLAARAQLVSYICFTLEILFIELLLKSGKKRYGVSLFIIATLIANLHAAVWYMFFILALPYLGEWILIKIMESNLSCNVQLITIDKKIRNYEKKIKKDNNKDKIKQKIEELQNKMEKIKILKEKRNKAVEKMEENSLRIKYIKRDNIKLLIIILIICIFSGLLTPQTSFEPYTHIFKLMKGNSTSRISEHQPTILIDSIETLVILTILAIMLMFTDTKVTLKDLFMLIGLFFLTLMSRRQTSLLALIGVYSVNIIIWDFVIKYDNINIEEKIINKITTGYGTLVIILLAILLGVNFYGKKYKYNYIDESSYPVGVAQYILDNLDTNEIKIYNSYNFGSYLLYKGIPVFIDSRCDLYTKEFNGRNIFFDALDIEGLASSSYYEDKFEEYGVTHVITYDDSSFKMILEHDDNYKIIYNDDNFYLFERISIKEGE